MKNEQEFVPSTREEMIVDMMRKGYSYQEMEKELDIEVPVCVQKAKKSVAYKVSCIHSIQNIQHTIESLKEKDVPIRISPCITLEEIEDINEKCQLNLSFGCELLLSEIGNGGVIGDIQWLSLQEIIDNGDGFIMREIDSSGSEKRRHVKRKNILQIFKEALKKY